MTDLAVQLILAGFVPALLVSTAPRHWLKRVMIGWLIAPLFVFFAVIIWEILTGPPIEDVVGRILSGLTILSSILALPWIAVSLVGFGLGFLFRRLFWRELKPGTPSPANVGGDAQQQADTSLKFHPKPIAKGAIVANGWRNDHIGFENDGLVIGGLSVWRCEWRLTVEGPVRLPHPAYPAQIHSYDIYEIGDENGLVRFATAELSNGVWGFYLPASRG